MLTPYHAPKSRSSRIIWLLEELALYASRSPTFAHGRIAPRIRRTRIPTRRSRPCRRRRADHRSIAICLYLTDKFPAAGSARRSVIEARPYLTWLVLRRRHRAGGEPVPRRPRDNQHLQRARGGRDKLDAASSRRCAPVRTSSAIASPPPT
jgi:hypothetical protein